jgi:hypothetical protein
MGPAICILKYSEFGPGPKAMEIFTAHGLDTQYPVGYYM